MVILFAGGIVYMMMALAGSFELKVKPVAPAAPGGPAAEGRNAVGVRLVKRPRTESAVGTIRPSTRSPSRPRSWPGSRSSR